MTRTLVAKLLRDVRVQLLIVALLLAAFECLWAKITQRILEDLLPAFERMGVRPDYILKVLFQGPGKVLQTLLGGESISIQRTLDLLSIGFVHPLVQTILCVWAVGRASGAIAGEIDRGTMELLLAQPVARWRVVAAHLCVDLATIPVLCLSLWGGTWLGTWLVGILRIGAPMDTMEIIADPLRFGPALVNVAALLFAVSGTTMWLSARGRFRGRVMGLAVLVTLLQFLVNVVGQLWDFVDKLRPLTVFYYYQPQQIILHGEWNVKVAGASVNGSAVLLAVGVLGYLLALRTFCRRDLPAPL